MMPTFPLNSYKIIFLNQMAGPLFRELAEDLSDKWAPCLLYTGHPDTVSRPQGGKLCVKEAPVYDRKNFFTRLYSWIHYFFRAILLLANQQKHTTIFIVSNPPFLGLAGLIFKIIKGMRYVVLVYDVYPDILVNTGKIKSRFLVACWDVFNRIIYNYASLVLTIDKDMAKLLSKKLVRNGSEGQCVITIHPWADTDSIRPIAKENNPFAKKHALGDRTVVLYSGNMGHTHLIETLLDAALELAVHPEIHFLFIGEGVKYRLVERYISDKKLQNATLLPFQPEEVLPFSMASGDIGIVAYEKGSQGCMLPSKMFYYMAAGLMPLIISQEQSNISEYFKKVRCGLRIGDVSGAALANVILEIHNSPYKLSQFKTNSRNIAVRIFSRNNTEKFKLALQSIGL